MKLFQGLRYVASSLKLRLLIAGILLVVLYGIADWRAVAGAVAGLQPVYLLLALLMFIPQTIVSAVRWRMLVSSVFRISIVEALRQTLVASGWNLFVPSKLGDLTRASMLPYRNRAQHRFGIIQSFKEKLFDVTALASILLIGMSAGWPSWAIIVLCVGAAFVWWCFPRPSRLVPAAGCSLLLWTLHLIQIDLFLKSAGLFVTWHVSAARIPVAIFAGLLPVTPWGVGTRDAALVWLFSDVAPVATMAAVGLLTASRYLIPGLAGLAVGTIWGIGQADRPAEPAGSQHTRPRIRKKRGRTATATAASPRA